MSSLQCFALFLPLLLTTAPGPLLHVHCCSAPLSIWEGLGACISVLRFAWSRLNDLLQLELDYVCNLCRPAACRAWPKTRMRTLSRRQSHVNLKERQRIGQMRSLDSVNFSVAFQAAALQPTPKTLQSTALVEQSFVNVDVNDSEA